MIDVVQLMACAVRVSGGTLRDVVSPRILFIPRMDVKMKGELEGSGLSISEPYCGSNLSPLITSQEAVNAV